MIPIHEPEWLVGKGGGKRETICGTRCIHTRGEEKEWRIRGSEDRIGEVDRIRLDEFD